jgi:hypothetical protein
MRCVEMETRLELWALQVLMRKQLTAEIEFHNSSEIKLGLPGNNRKKLEKRMALLVSESTIKEEGVCDCLKVSNQLRKSESVTWGFGNFSLAEG